MQWIPVDETRQPVDATKQARVGQVQEKLNRTFGDLTGVVLSGGSQG